MERFTMPAESDPTLIEKVTKANLKTAMKAAQGMLETSFDSLILIDDTERNTDRTLKTDSCNTQNRVMLDKLYELAHVDIEGAVADEGVIGDSRDRRIKLFSPHGITFTEHYASSDVTDWQSFAVTVEPTPVNS